MSKITINNVELPVVEYRGQRVVTLAMVDQAHERTEGTAGRNFREHRERLIEGEDYFELTADEIRRQSLGHAFAARTAKGAILTESGYLMLVKSLQDDLAWEVQRNLVKTYFRKVHAAPALPDFSDPAAAARAWADQFEEKTQARIERDEAVRTKAMIGHKREATAMATASRLSREVGKLRDQLGFSARQATVLQVEEAMKRDFDWRPLRKWCLDRSIAPEIVPDKRYPNGVKAWPASAWLAVYSVDLEMLFGMPASAACLLGTARPAGALQMGGVQ